MGGVGADARVSAPMDPRTPVLVGTAQVSNSDGDAEPINLMTTVAEQALADTGSASIRDRISSVRVVRGIWPYQDPATLVADRLGLTDVSTAITQIGGNEAFDLLTASARSISEGTLDAVVICSAEAMRTRRRDRAAGNDTRYVTESPDASPDIVFGKVREMTSDAQNAVGLFSAVGFYAMAETALRHRRGESPSEHLDRVSALWATGSEVASRNPNAWLSDVRTASDVGTITQRNRMVSSPYRKLMTSNLNVDQAAAVVLCSAEVAAAAGVPRDRWVFPLAGTGASDHWELHERWALDESPAMRIAGQRALELGGVTIEEVDLLDLYSCFPAAVQVGQRELGIDPDRPFTITGAMTFAGGPFNSYCMHSLARSIELLRAGDGSLALLTGNGGYFTKHSYALLGSSPSGHPYGADRPQEQVDALPRRKAATSIPMTAELETCTVMYDREGEPEKAIIAALDADGSRTFANCIERQILEDLVARDACGDTVNIDPSGDVPIVVEVV